MVDVVMTNRYWALALLATVFPLSAYADPATLSGKVSTRNEKVEIGISINSGRAQYCSVSLFAAPSKRRVLHAKDPIAVIETTPSMKAELEAKRLDLLRALTPNSLRPRSVYFMAELVCEEGQEEVEEVTPVLRLRVPSSTSGVRRVDDWLRALERKLRLKIAAPTRTPTGTGTKVPTPKPPKTPTSAPTRASTPTRVPTRTPVVSPTRTPVVSATATRTATPSSTPTPVVSPTPITTPTPMTTPVVSGRDDLVVSSASMIGSARDDAGEAVDVAPNGTIIMGGSFPGLAPQGVSTTSLLSGGDGAVLSLNATGTSIQSIVRIGASVADLEVAPNGLVAVGGSFGVAVLRGNQLVWSATPGNVERVAIGSDGTVAAIAGGKAHVYNATGGKINEWSSGQYLKDVAVDGASGTILLAGFSQKNVSGYCMAQLQVAWLKGFSYNGTQKWKRYDWTPQQVAPGGSGLCADTRGLRVSIGRDGMAYFGGESAGGNSIFHKSASDLSQNAPNAVTDPYNNPYNTGSNHISYVAKFNPGTGEQVKGSFILSRLTSGRGNTVRFTAVTADEQGRVYVGGTTAAHLKDRVLQKINGMPIGTYSGGEGFVLLLSPDFGTRLKWTAFTKNGSSTGAAIAVRQGRAAFAGTSGTDAVMMTVNPVQPAKGGLKDAFLASWQSGSNQ